MSTIRLFGLDIWSRGFGAAISELSVAFRTPGRAKIVVTPNVDHLVRLDRNRELTLTYRKADFVFPDGFPIVLASKLFGRDVQERVTGADLFPAMMKELASFGGKAFILGGMPGSTHEIEQKLMKKYMGLEVRAYAPAFGFTADNKEARAAVDMINSWEPHAVFVCLGMPKQEVWAFRYRDELRTRLVFCVGAALEFDLGLTKRAPAALQKMGLEWLWRLLSDPGRLWKRYLIDDIGFLRLVAREALSLVNRIRK